MSNTAQMPEYDPFAFHTGDRLRKARELEGLSLTQLADRIGVTRKTVSAYETWTSLEHPRESTLRQWSLACRVSLEWLKTGEGDPRPDGALAQLAELRTFNPKRQRFSLIYGQDDHTDNSAPASLHLVTSSL